MEATTAELTLGITAPTSEKNVGLKILLLLLLVLPVLSLLEESVVRLTGSVNCGARVR